MPANPVHPDLVEHALKLVKGTPFEDFTQEFLAALIGPSYVPIGGIQDGGADGLFADKIFEETGDTHAFMQASVQLDDPEGKIRQTVERLREFEREPRSLLYITSREIKHLDRVAHDLTVELDVVVRIMDGKYVAAHINDSPQTIASFEHYLRPVTEYLKTVGSSSIIAKSRHVTAPAVYVFLRQEVERRAGNTTLIDAVTDALILWALDGTDPDDGRLLSRADIEARICETVPFAKEFVADGLGARLEYLSAKERAHSRVRWHKREDLFALPYETREEIGIENAEDENLRLTVIEGLRLRIEELAEGDLKDAELDVASTVGLRAFQLLFEQEGLELASYIARDDHAPQELQTVQDCIRTALAETDVRPGRQPIIGDNVLRAMSGVFYASTEDERRYLGKLSRTYSLLFTLNTEPRLVAYFQEMTGDFYLYVGTDILVRALSERYLDPKDQMTRNVLRMAADAGATLVLAEPVLDEVVSHLRASDREFEVNFTPLGKYRFTEAETNSPRILVRAYFHALNDKSLGDKRPRSWEAYVNQFVDHDKLHKAQAHSQLRQYLTSEYNLTFESADDIKRVVDPDRLEALAADLTGVKEGSAGADQRAFTDALMVLGVYGRRDDLKEHSQTSEYGLRTWWLTGEARILGKTKQLVTEHGGERFVMRPEFLLEYLALAPSAAEVRTTYANVFPTVLGIKLSRRMDDEVFHSLMEKVREADEVDEGRRHAQIAGNADRLKSDFQRDYRRRFTDSN